MSTKREAMPSIAYRCNDELKERISSVLTNATPELVNRVKDASAKLGMTNRESNTMLFFDFAIYHAFQLLEGKADEKPANPRFGTRIEQDVNDIMATNRKIRQENPDQTWMLTAIGSTLLRNRGHNPVSVRRWIAENQHRLDVHHAEIGITDVENHNRIAGKTRKMYENQ